MGREGDCCKVGGRRGVARSFRMRDRECPSSATHGPDFWDNHAEKRGKGLMSSEQDRQWLFKYKELEVPIQEMQNGNGRT